MTQKWITGLLRARQFTEDNAKSNLATAERLASRAHARVRYNEQRLDSLRAAGAESSATSFVAAAVALQAAAASVAAAASAAAAADQATSDRRGELTEAAVSRRSAEELEARVVAAERARLAAIAQRGTDEVAATVYRRNRRAADEAADTAGADRAPDDGGAPR